MDDINKLGLNNYFSNNNNRKIDELINSFNELARQTEIELTNTNKRMTEYSGEQNELKNDFNYLMIAISMGINPGEYPFIRFLPCKIYLSEETNVDNIYSKSLQLLDQFGFKKANEFPVERSSFFQKLFFKSKEILSREDVQEELEKLKRAIELAFLQIKQAEIDEKQADAASSLIKSLESTESAALQIGSLLIIKTKTEKGASIFSRSLTPKEMICIDKNPELLKNPNEILNILSKIPNNENIGNNKLTG